MKKILQHLRRILIMLLALGIMWLLSWLPANLLNGIAVVTMILSVLVFCGTTVYYLKNIRHITCVILAVMMVFPAFARSIEDCDEYDRASVDEGNYCRYGILIDDVGSQVCSFSKTFNPTRAQKGSEETRMQEQVNNANKIVQAYNELNEAYQRSLSGECKTLTPEDQDKSTADRLSILRNNNSPLCCAWALQTEFQMYTAQNGERQIETVPMMLANEQMQCWPCDVVYLLITLANTMAYRSAPAMAAVGLFFLKWMLIFWIILKIGSMFLNRNYDGKQYGLGQFFKDLFTRLCWAGLVALILSDTAAQLNDKTVTNMTNINTVRSETLLDDTYKRIVNPPFEMIAAVGIEMASALMRGENSFYGRVAKAVDMQSDTNVSVYGAAIKRGDYCASNASVRNSPMYQHLTRGGPSAGYQLDVASQGRAISDDTTRNLLCLTQLAFQGLAPISAAGSIITTHAIKNAWSLPFPLPGSLPIIPQLFYGLILMVVCWLMGVAVGFRVIDIMVRVAMMIMLCPMFMVAAVFPLTRDTAKKGLVFFVSAIMGFVEVSLAVGMSVPCFYHAIASNGNEKELIDAMVAPSTSNYVPNLYEQFSAGGMKFFLFISVVGWMGFKLLESVEMFFGEIFDVQNVGRVGKGGSMSGSATSVRAEIGSTYDTASKIRQDSKVFRNLSYEKRLKRQEERRKKREAEGKKSVGQKFFESKTGRAGLRAYQKGKDMANKAKEKMNKVKEFAKNNKITRGAKAVGKKLGGNPVVNNKVTRGLWKGVKKVAPEIPKFAKKQLKEGIHDFFHPPQS